MADRAAAPRVAFKSCPADFVVEELFATEFTGSGEHGYFFVEKRGRNTEDVVDALVAACSVRRVDVGYAGRKDKHAVTRQWFSVHGVFAWPDLDDPAIACLRQERHTHKLRRGVHAGNRFEIVLRSASRQAAQQLEALHEGFANYFGPQRVNPANCQAAREWLDRRQAARASERAGEGTGEGAGAQASEQRRKQRGRPRNKPGRGRRRAVAGEGWHLSVLRSELFNAVLSHRAARAEFPEPLPGDHLIDGVPTGPLWGRGRSSTSDAALAIEQAALAPHAAVCDALEHAGVDQARRPLWVTPGDFSCELSGDCCTLGFTLPPGAYATALLDHAVILEEPARG